MELKDDQWDSLYVFAKTLEDKHVNFSEIEKQLTTKTDDAFLIKEIMTQIKKVHYAVKRKQGFVKLGFGTSIISKNLKEKIKLYKDAGFKVYVGGTLFEAFIIRNQFDDYIAMCKDYNIDVIEVSDG